MAGGGPAGGSALPSAGSGGRGGGRRQAAALERRRRAVVAPFLPPDPVRGELVGRRRPRGGRGWSLRQAAVSLLTFLASLPPPPYPLPLHPPSRSNGGGASTARGSSGGGGSRTASRFHGDDNLHGGMIVGGYPLAGLGGWRVASQVVRRGGRLPNDSSLVPQIRASSSSVSFSSFLMCVFFYYRMVICACLMFMCFWMNG